MKSSKVITALAVANLALLAAVGYLLKERSGAAARTGEPASPRILTNVQRVVVKTAPPSVLTVTNEFGWTQLETEDYREYIARLRSIGCPEQTIRDIVIADLDKLLAPKAQAIYGRRKDLKYWHSEEEELANDFDHRDWARQERSLDREKREVILELLGFDLVRERMKQRGYEDYYERRLGWLPEGKRDAVRLVIDKFDELEENLEEGGAEGSSSLSAAAQAQRKQLLAERQAALTNLLSAAELEQYELWMSPAANAVRYAFYGMDTTEEEFLAVYKLRQAFEAQWNPEEINLNDDATLEKWNAARQELEAQIKETLGEKRFAEYRRGEDPDFHQMSAVVTRFKLPREKAADLYEIKRALVEARNQVLANNTLDPTTKDSTLTTMTAETEAAVKEVLGGKAFDYYQRQGLGEWIKR